MIDTTGKVEIVEEARRLVEMHGDDAPFHAAVMAQSLLDRGDRAGHLRWSDIGRRTNLLLSRTALGEVAGRIDHSG